MNSYMILFHLAAKCDPEFLEGDSNDTLLTMEVNRLRWDEVPSPYGDRSSFATGYVMGREKMGRDPSLPKGQNPAYDEGFAAGIEVLSTGEKPDWDAYRFTGN